MMASRADFSDDEWKILEFAPYAVFLEMCGKDGNATHSEMDAVAKAIIAASDPEKPLSKYPFVRDLYESVGKDLPAIGGMVTEAIREHRDDDFVAEIAESIGILENKATSEEVRGFKLSLVLMGLAVGMAPAEQPDVEKVKNESITLDKIVRAIDAEDIFNELMEGKIL